MCLRTTEHGIIFFEFDGAVQVKKTIKTNLVIMYNKDTKEYSIQSGCELSD